MPIQTFDMVQLEVKNFSGSVKWYEEKLGLSVLVREDDDRIAFLAKGDGPCKLAIFGVETTKAGSGSHCYPCFEVNDLSGTISELKKKGLEFDGPPSGGADKGFRGARLWDNERNTVFIYEMLQPKGR